MLWTQSRPGAAMQAESTSRRSGPLSDPSDSDSSADEDASVTGFELSLFPAPPPLSRRRRHKPPPLVLRPSASVVRLPPSPGFSDSYDSSPVATPTTARSPPPRPILKKPLVSRRGLTFSPPSSPPSSPLPPSPVTAVPIITTTARLRPAQSVPHLPAFTGSHRNTSSDSIAHTRRPPLPIHAVQCGYAI
ncbi:hypothetical protein HMN09_00528200 [Mycena chlorophos]|uniref:Uncharacterized protein n=1 Tax=Mycena chlorophos TaxID=658473 RepID=A0A8H6WG84_MYCCL|nr:hypothetical protein HMN09_00528200 [Mycena chlorophos]